MKESPLLSTNDMADREDTAYYNFVAAFRQEHKRFPRPEEAWQARAALDIAPEGKDEGRSHDELRITIANLLADNEKLTATMHMQARAAEMSANIMRDRKRTGGWPGADKTANAFDRIATSLKKAIDSVRDSYTVAALRTTKPADDEREPEGFYRWFSKLNGNPNSEAEIKQTLEDYAAFNEQQMGERREES